MHDDVLHVDVSNVNGSALVTIRGDIDACSVVKLKEVLDELSLVKQIVFDMADVRFTDSSGVNALVSHAVDANGDGSLHIRNPSRAVQRVVEISGLGYLFDEAKSA